MMKCPVCVNQELNKSYRHNVEIDFCPNCQGVWLDRGELDKIIEITMLMDKDNIEQIDPAAKRTTQNSQVLEDDIDERDSSRAEWNKKKKKNFLEEIFNIFD